MKEIFKKNTTIGLWSFLFVVFGSINYLKTLFIDRECMYILGNYPVYFLIFLAGYMVIDHFKKYEKRDKKDSSSKAWNYTLEIFKKVFPIFLLGVLLSFIVSIIVNKIAVVDIGNYFIAYFNDFIGMSHVLNKPLVLVSELIICSLFLYYFLAKNEDFFKGLVAPIIIVIVHASLTKSNNVFIVIALMCLGVMSFYVVEYLKKKKFSEKSYLLMSFAHVLLAVFIIYTTSTGYIGGLIFNEFLYYLFFIILLVNKDYIVVLYNKSELCNWLGKISLYYYIFFSPIIILMLYIFPDMNYMASIVFSIVFCLCWSFIIWALTELVAISSLNKKNKI